MGGVHEGVGTARRRIGTVDVRFVHRGIDTTGPIVATLEGEKWLHEGIGIAGPCIATVHMGKYIHRGIGTAGTCIGTINGRYVHQGIGIAGPCIGTIDSTNRLEQLAGGAALLLKLLD